MAESQKIKPTITDETFEAALKAGHAGEERVKRALESGVWHVKTTNATRAKDLTAWRRFAVEVKNEDAFAGKGTICIETGQGEPPRLSGIMTSKSDVCVHTLGDRAVLYRTSRMRAYIIEYDLRVELFKGGDNANRGVIVRTEDVWGYAWYQEVPFEKIPDSFVWCFYQ